MTAPPIREGKNNGGARNSSNGPERGKEGPSARRFGSHGLGVQLPGSRGGGSSGHALLPCFPRTLLWLAPLGLLSRNHAQAEPEPGLARPRKGFRLRPGRQLDCPIPFSFAGANGAEGRDGGLLSWRDVFCALVISVVS